MHPPLTTDPVRDPLAEGVRHERAGEPELALKLYREAEAAAPDAARRAEALWRQSYALRETCRWEEALDAARRSGALAQEAGARDQLAEALNAEALVHLSQGLFERAEPLLRRMLSFADDPRLRGIALQNLGNIAAQSGRLAQAEQHFAESRRCFVATGYRRGEVTALTNQGRVALDRGDVPGGAAVLLEAITLARELDEREMEALATLNYGEALLRQDDAAGAERMARAALAFYASAGDSWRRVESLQLLGDVSARRGDAEAARDAWLQALAVARALSARLEIASLERRLTALATG